MPCRLYVQNIRNPEKKRNIRARTILSWKIITVTLYKVRDNTIYFQLTTYTEDVYNFDCITNRIRTNIIICTVWALTSSCISQRICFDDGRISRYTRIILQILHEFLQCHFPRAENYKIQFVLPTAEIKISIYHFKSERIVDCIIIRVIMCCFLRLKTKDNYNIIKTLYIVKS